jgi:3-oxoacyl-[acyl-carrier-protein] synthase-1
MENRVVITGMGIYSCIGTSLEEVRESLYQGKSGIVLDQERKNSVSDQALQGLFRNRILKTFKQTPAVSMGEESEYAYLATIDALNRPILTKHLWIPMKWDFIWK